MAQNIQLFGLRMSWFYDPSSEDSYQAGHLLSFSVWSESSLPAGRNLMSLPTHRENSLSFSAKSCRRLSPRTFAEKTLGEISDFCFSPRKKLFRKKGVPRRNAKKVLFSCADLYTIYDIINKLTPLHVSVRLRKRFSFLPVCLKWKCIIA